jgi:hypothetical protein
MSAADVIEQIKQLPPEEWGKVRSFMEKSSPKPDPSVVSDDFKAIAGKVFSKNEELFRKLAQ